MYKLYLHETINAGNLVLNIHGISFRRIAPTIVLPIFNSPFDRFADAFDATGANWDDISCANGVPYRKGVFEKQLPTVICSLKNRVGTYLIGKMRFHAGCTYFSYFVSLGNNLRVRSSVSLCPGGGVVWITQKARQAIRFHVCERANFTRELATMLDYYGRK